MKPEEKSVIDDIRLDIYSDLTGYIIYFNNIHIIDLILYRLGFQSISEFQKMIWNRYSIKTNIDIDNDQIYVNKFEEVEEIIKEIKLTIYALKSVDLFD